MTTTVFDGAARLVTSDSRWSAPLRSAIAFVDDTGFGKIELASGNAFVFAGDSAQIAEWKSWLHSSPTGAAGHPPATKGINMLIANVDSGKVAFEFGQSELPNARFGGSGAIHARDCWAANGDGRRAVETAKLFDPYTGGSTKFLEFGSGRGNFADEVGLDGLRDAFLQRGKIMYMNSTKAIVPVDVAAQQDPQVHALRDKIAAGEVSMSAPCHSMYNEWSDQDRQRLDAVLDRIFLAD
ncbi:hypothetical protein [Cupriavidus sp. a3]|uniref:hypothetical protein n=1 Tax=Cupriavidus sp. a3 TaxID=3242158 RepID=UPI003D9C5DAD